MDIEIIRNTDPSESLPALRRPAEDILARGQGTRWKSAYFKAATDILCFDQTSSFCTNCTQWRGGTFSAAMAISTTALTRAIILFGHFGLPA